jgi:valyl-tRNA synthetase
MTHNEAVFNRLAKVLDDIIASERKEIMEKINARNEALEITDAANDMRRFHWNNSSILDITFFGVAIFTLIGSLCY